MVDALTKLAEELSNKFGIDASVLKEVLRIDKPAEEVTLTVPAGGSAVIPKGVYLISASGVTLEYSPDGGTTWRAVGSPGGIVISDGESVRLSNSGTVDVTAYLLKFV